MITIQGEIADRAEFMALVLAYSDARARQAAHTARWESFTAEEEARLAAGCSAALSEVLDAVYGHTPGCVCVECLAADAKRDNREDMV